MEYTDEELNAIYIVARISAEADSIYEGYGYIPLDEDYDLEGFEAEMFNIRRDGSYAEYKLKYDGPPPYDHAALAVDIIKALS